MCSEDILITGTLARDLWLLFFLSSKASSWSPESTLDYSWIWIWICRDIHIQRSFRVLSKYAEGIIFVKLEQNNQLFYYLWTLDPVCTHINFFWSIVLLRAVKKIILFQIFKIIWAHSPNTPNGSVNILRTRGRNLFVYWEHENTRVNLWVNEEYAE